MSNVIEGTFFEHLDELRRRLWTVVGAFLVSASAALLYSDRLLEMAVAPILSESAPLYFFTPADALTVKIKLALLAGLLISSPVILGQLWLFISPAMHGHEKKAALPFIALTSALFLAGAAFSFWKVVPVTLHFLLSMQTEWMRPMLSVSEYLSFLTMMVVAFGIAFNLPIFILIPVMAGVLNTRMLNQFQRHVAVLVFIAAAILTPGPDIASQLMLAIPLLVLFELSVLGAVIIEKLVKKKKEKVIA